MGIVNNITATRFPRQQPTLLNKEVSVCFHFNSLSSIPGIVVRADAEAPWETIIELADGRFVRSAECQYRIAITRRAGDKP